MTHARGLAGLLLALVVPAALAAPPRADWGLATPAARPWLGISVTEVEGGDDPTPGPGLTLARVAPGSPAEKAGLRPGDVLLAVGDAVLERALDLRESLQGRRPGDVIAVTALREKKVMTLSLRLGEAPSNAQPERREQPVPSVAAAPTAQAGPTIVVTTPRAPAPPAPAAPRAVGQPAAPPASVALTYVGATDRPSLGIDTMDLEPGLAAYFGAAEGQGVLIESVAAGSPAALGGATAGDVLLELGGKPVPNGAGLSQLLRTRAVGERVALTVLRGGRRLQLVTTLQRETVPEWRLEAPAAPSAPAKPEALSALVQHNAREIARLEVLLAAQEEGDEELASVLARSGHGTALKADAAALRERLTALRREMTELQAQIDRSRAPRR